MEYTTGGTGSTEAQDLLEAQDPQGPPSDWYNRASGGTGIMGSLVHRL